MANSDQQRFQISGTTAGKAFTGSGNVVHSPLPNQPSVFEGVAAFHRSGKRFHILGTATTDEQPIGSGRRSLGTPSLDTDSEVVGTQSGSSGLRGESHVTPASPVQPLPVWRRGIPRRLFEHSENSNAASSEPAKASAAIRTRTGGVGAPGSPMVASVAGDDQSSSQTGRRYPSSPAQAQGSSTGIELIKGRNEQKKKSSNKPPKLDSRYLIFPHGRIKRLLRSSCRVPRVSNTASIYLAAVLEYMTAEVLDEAGSNTKAAKRKIIMPRDVAGAINDDVEMNTVIEPTRHGYVIIKGTGVKGIGKGKQRIVMNESEALKNRIMKNKK